MASCGASNKGTFRTLPHEAKRSQASYTSGTVTPRCPKPPRTWCAVRGGAHVRVCMWRVGRRASGEKRTAGGGRWREGRLSPGRVLAGGGRALSPSVLPVGSELPVLYTLPCSGAEVQGCTAGAEVQVR